MRQSRRNGALLAIVTMVVSLFVALPATASYADSAPTSPWPSAASIGSSSIGLTTSPNGDVTVGCIPTSSSGGQNLTTYSSTGAITRQLSRASIIDGVTNCIMEPIVDKTGVLYGLPYNGATAVYGPNLLAYSGSTLKWQYPTSCTSSYRSQYVVGADGNIYITKRFPDGSVHVIGLAPNLVVGETAPRVVLDIKTTNNCTLTLFAYAKGLILRAQGTNKAVYYNYAGKYLGETATGYEAPNAAGWLFRVRPVAGGSVNISAYDPMLNQEVWNKPASTPGAQVSGYALYPLPSGGVAGLITEQKMSVSGIPSVPIEYINTLVILDAAGNKVKSISLLNTDDGLTTGNKYVDSPYVTVSSDGRLIVLRQLDRKTGISSPSVLSEIVIQVVSAAGVLTTLGSIKGNVNQTGYKIANTSVDGSAEAGVNSISVAARCTGNCSPPAGQQQLTNLFAVSLTGLKTEYPRGEVLSTAFVPQPTPREYAALGDSFSSGEGIFPFEDGTDSAGYDICHRSLFAYSKLLSQDPISSLSLVPGGFAACSGAETIHIAGPNPKNNEDEQWNSINGNTKVVTLTIGGNDVLFVDFATACVFGSCSVGSTAYNNSLTKINTVLSGNLQTAYTEILAKAPAAQIYVLDYPHVAPVKISTDLPDLACPYLYDSGQLIPAWSDAFAARDIVTKLDAKISTTITSMNNPRLHYVPVNNTGSPFVGHTVCAGENDSYFNNINQAFIGGKSFVFHPNSKGQQAYASVLKGVVS